MIKIICVALSALCLVVVPLMSVADEPLIVAHRGQLLQAPENTLVNFRACLELRLGFEFDVEKIKDGHLVCIHDGTVDRTTNGTGKVSELTLEEIRSLDAGNWFDLEAFRRRLTRLWSPTMGSTAIEYALSDLTSAKRNRV